MKKHIPITPPFPLKVFKLASSGQGIAALPESALGAVGLGGLGRLGAARGEVVAPSSKVDAGATTNAGVTIDVGVGRGVDTGATIGVDANTGTGTGTESNLAASSSLASTEATASSARDGKIGFFWNTLPDEEVVEFRVTKNKTHYFEAIATEVIPSPQRVEPRDAQFLATSPWQIFDYQYELAQKQLILAELFGTLADCPPINPIQTDWKDFYYRNKMEYALYYDHADEQIHLAVHQRGTHRKMPIKSSSIERPEIFAAAQAIVADLNARKVDARQYQSILLRASQAGVVSGGLLENHQPHPVFPQLTDTILGSSYTYSPNGFFQVNLPVYELALRAIQAEITTEKVLDLYAGVGTIGLSVAAGRELTLVEVNQSAYQELVKNCQNCSNHRAKPVLAKSEEVLELIAPDVTVILDPPRAGCDAKLIHKLNEVLPPALIYLSCNPITQLRDLKLLQEHYEIKTIIPYNFFPRTPHLENLVVLRRKTGR